MSLTKVAKFPLWLNLSVARRLSSSDVESSRHNQAYGDSGGKLNRLRNVKILPNRWQDPFWGARRCRCAIC